MRAAPKITVLANLLGLIMHPLTALSSEESHAARHRLVEQLDEIRQRNNVAAMGLVIVEGDRVTLLKTLGLHDRVSGEPVRDDAIFRIGSISKMFTGLLAAELDYREVVDLESGIHREEMADTYRNPYRESHPIRLDQLLEQTAGFTDMIKPEWDYSDPAQLPLEKTLRMYPQARVAQWPPGVHYSYTNAGAGLAGYFLELDTGKSYEDLLAQFVLEPLGMADTSVLPPDGNRLAAGYDTDGFSSIPYWHQIFRPFGAINSTLEDMSRFVRVFINRGTLDGERVFSADTIERVETPRTSLAARRGLTSGYGLGNYDWLRDGIRFQGHGGDADGYLSRMGYTLANNSGYFLVITAFQGRTLRAMRRLVEQYLVADLTPPDIPPAPVLEEKDVSGITGRYRRLTYRFPAQAETVGREVLTIRFENGDLVVLDASGRARRLVPTAKGLFRWADEPRASQFIGRDESAEIYYLDGSHSWVRSAP